MSNQIDPVIFQLIADSAPFSAGFQKAAADAATNGAQISASIDALNKSFADTSAIRAQQEMFDKSDAAARTYAQTWRDSEAAKVAAITQGEAQVQQAMGRTAGAASSMGGITGGVAREIGVLFGEGLRGNFTRMEGSIVTLANRMGVLSSFFGPIGIAVGAVSAALAFAIENMIATAANAQQLGQALAATNNNAGQTVAQLQALTAQVEATGASMKDARQSVLDLAQSGLFAGQTLNQAALGVAAFADLTGKKIGDAEKAFEALGKDPVAATLKLNESMHLLDASTVSMIAEAQESGNKFLAVGLAVNAWSKAMGDANEQQHVLNDTSKSVAVGIDTEAAGIELMSGAWEQSTAAMKKARDAKAALIGAGKIISNAETVDVDNFVVAMAKETKQFTELTGKVGETKVALVDYQLEQAKATLQATLLSAATNQFNQSIKNGQNVFEASLATWSSFTKALKDGNDALEDAAWKAHQAAAALDAHTASIKAAREQEQEQKKNAGELAVAEKAVNDELERGIQQDPKLRAAADARTTAMDKANTLLAVNDQALKVGNESLDEWRQNVDNAVLSQAEANDRMEKAIEIHKALALVQGDQGTALDQLTAKWRAQDAELGMSSQAIAANNEKLKDEKAAWDALNKTAAAGGTINAEVIRSTLAEADAHAAMTTAVKANAEAIKQWEGIAQNGLYSFGTTIAQTLTGGIHSFKDFEKSILGDFTQFIAAMIEQILKLTVFNGILNSVFGSSLPTSSFGSILGSASSLFGNGSGVTGDPGASGTGASPAAGGTSLVGSALSLASTGKSAYGFLNGGGLSSLWGGSATGGSTFMGGGVGQNFMGPLAPGQSYGYTPTPFGYAAGAAAGLYAGVSEYKAAGGGAAGVAGGLAYGIGTAGLIGGVGGVLAGTGFSAGLAGGLGAGAAAGAGAEGLAAAIPVIGWIALAAMLVNMFTGGGLFGTAANKFDSGHQDISIGQGGADVDTSVTLKGKKALFGGSYYKTKGTPTDPATQKAYDDFDTQLIKGRDDFAKSFGVTMGDIVGGTLNNTFDKNGKVTKTTDTVLGVTRTETGQQFAERLQADNYLAVLDKMGLGASDFVSGIQDDADKLFATTQDMASTVTAINTNVTAGFKFLAISGDQTIKTVFDFTKAQQAAGETLSQTYNRLMQAQTQYNQFTAQFKPAKSYVDPFEAQMAQINDAMKANIDQANAYAIAAGAEGASTEDLVNIHKYAAAQVAQAIQTLQASAQSLAFSLGVSNIGSLDQINQEISDLENGTASAATSVSNFGSAITKTSKAASEAMALMLGNLSPLNDQQKLQAALSGLRAGTASKEDVLNIGRSLYASSQAYTDLYNQVQQYGGRGSGGGAGGGGHTSGSTHHTLSAEDQAKLAQLQKEKASLEKAQTAAQYQTLAQQIEEIASAKGETYQQVIDEMGIDMKGLEKGLSIKDDADFAAYMAKIKDQVDSDGNNTDRIVEAINLLPTAIAIAIKPIAAGTGTTPVKPGPAVPGNSSTPGYAPGGQGDNVSHSVAHGVVTGLNRVLGSQGGGRFYRGGR